MDALADKLAARMNNGGRAVAAGVPDVYVYVGNEEFDAYIATAQDRRSIRTNGR